MEVLNIMTATKQYDVIIIGAGPSGSVAGSMLIKKGYSVLIIEKQHFPRFSIGESLLPQCMAFLEEAELDHVLTEHAEQLGFQFKNGAAFHKKGKNSSFNWWLCPQFSNLNFKASSVLAKHSCNNTLLV